MKIYKYITFWYILMVSIEKTVLNYHHAIIFTTHFKAICLSEVVDLSFPLQLPKQIRYFFSGNNYLLLRIKETCFQHQRSRVALQQVRVLVWILLFHAALEPRASCLTFPELSSPVKGGTALRANLLKSCVESKSAVYIMVLRKCQVDTQQYKVIMVLKKSLLLL